MAEMLLRCAVFAISCAAFLICLCLDETVRVCLYMCAMNSDTLCHEIGAADQTAHFPNQDLEFHSTFAHTRRWCCLPRLCACQLTSQSLNSSSSHTAQKRSISS